MHRRRLQSLYAAAVVKVEVVVYDDDVIRARVGVVDLAGWLQLLGLMPVDGELRILSNWMRWHVGSGSLEAWNSLGKLQGILVLTESFVVSREGELVSAEVT